MFKISYHIVIYRYEAILALIILLLTGSIAVSSKDSMLSAFPPPQRYPYTIALTFDDGPHPEYTQRLLEVLKDNGVRATFFVVGSQVIKHPELLEMINAGGHEIESHTMTHPNLKKLKYEDIRKELMKAQNAIRNVTGAESRYYRPPGGQFDSKVLEAAAGLGLEMVLWTAFPKDHQLKNPLDIEKLVVEQSADGGVVILHSGLHPTLTALPWIIRDLRSKGFRFVTIEELKTERKASLQAWLRV